MLAAFVAGGSSSAVLNFAAAFPAFAASERESVCPLVVAPVAASLLFCAPSAAGFASGKALTVFGLGGFAA